ncbi:HEPN domain-containing protein [Rufibacter tibetensis]|nr:HEPN domain-containing protein [Rufibacter tibetensis]
MKEAVDDDFGNNVYQSFMDLFFTPEITRRKELNILGNEFALQAAQAVFFPDGRQNLVRLNNEVSAEVKLKPGVNKSIDNFWPFTSDVEHVRLNEEQFKNCGHATLILFRDGYQLSFDFQYNKHICAEHLIVAEEFLKTSKYALENDYLSAFIDNSFSTIELLAKTNLLVEANQHIKIKSDHRGIKSAFNLRFKNSESEFEINRRRLFNKLSQLRNKARYLEGEINICNQDAFSIYNTLKDMFDDLNLYVKSNNS